MNSNYKPFTGWSFKFSFYFHQENIESPFLQFRSILLFDYIYKFF